ncbi:hypothetical protein BLNAU_22626 [Blattamonas nauphoetae]|uniref:Uncharacterized protein n=1 Tax=Blattamonas nauphoetae TaxID=2049346 RepID=A0ABQ9WWQ7_9EUKA|nr:hypothetical protein BLNAU_22626 [Blattamonas nauphoetae]
MQEPRYPLPKHKLVESISVARVRPRTSKGITDLLLPQASPTCNCKRPCTTTHGIKKELQNLSILPVSGPAAGSTPGGALPSISLSFRLATILPPEPRDFDFSKGPDEAIKLPPIPKIDVSSKIQLRAFLTAAILVYTIRAGITAAAGTRLAL